MGNGKKPPDPRSVPKQHGKKPKAPKVSTKIHGSKPPPPPPRQGKPGILGRLFR